MNIMITSVNRMKRYKKHKIATNHGVDDIILSACANRSSFISASSISGASQKKKKQRKKKTFKHAVLIPPK